ncbi:hypothetical protein [Caballeronia ptereochthonis]|uniref:hypothetical protein n=1 Tax=Caballeronia ptereochthonis TaxID=1777144 RepID=UPI00118032B9|nr:hypothetical protein [Caballeronia ptereochthonis]
MPTRDVGRAADPACRPFLVIELALDPSMSIVKRRLGRHVDARFVLPPAGGLLARLSLGSSDPAAAGCAFSAIAG